MRKLKIGVFVGLALSIFLLPMGCNADVKDGDGKKYKSVKIGNQVWMAENLNYKVNSSRCYEDKLANCEKYGRLYDWETAMTVCPSGWSLPGEAEWNQLIDDVGGKDNAGTALKAKSGWDDYEGVSGNGTDAYGFSALPGGFGFSGGSFYDAGNDGYWWSATENDANFAWYRFMFYYLAYVFRGNGNLSYFWSVRCVRD